MDKGIVFDIKRFAIHDGPGIRTTVFLKGCPLRCPWCHNPEGLSLQPYIDYKNERCIGCQKCMEICPRRCIKKDSDGRYFVDDSGCVLCGACVDVCPGNARELIGKEMSAKELTAELERDRMFYEGNGGGVTFSGGEALLQHEFLLKVLSLCKKKHLHVALDTSGYSRRDVLKKIAPYVDLFLFDLKHMDPAKHKEYMGVDLQPIIENLTYLAQNRKKINVRIPIIPGFNDDDANISAYIKCLKGLTGIQQISLLPYHNTAKGKYERLFGKYQLLNIEKPSEDRMENLEALFRKSGFEVKIGG